MNNSIAFQAPHWEGTFERPGFGTSLPSQRRIQELQAEFVELTVYWTKQQVLTVMGVLNAYIYRAAMDTRVLRKDGRLHRVTNRLMAIAHDGIEVFNLTQQGICTYLKEHWPGASCGRTTIWKVRDLLADVFGLFSYQKQAFKAGEKKRGTAPDIENFDLVKALILYEHLEELYCTWHHQGFDGLPKHKGAIARLLFDAIFRNIARFRRKTMDSPQSSSQPVVVFWHNGIGYDINNKPVMALNDDRFYDSPCRTSPPLTSDSRTLHPPAFNTGSDCYPQ